MLAHLSAFFRSPLGRTLRVAISISLLAGLLSGTEWSAFRSERVVVFWPLFVGSLALTALAYPLCAWRWRVLLNSQGVPMPLHRAHAIVWIGQFYNAFLPGGVGGDTARLGYAFSSAPTQKTRITAATLADRTIGFAVLLALAAIAAAFHGTEFTLGASSQNRATAFGLLLLLVAVAVIALRVFFPRLPSEWRAAWRQLIHDRRAFASAVALSVAIWWLDFIAGWILARSIGAELPLTTLSLALSVAYLSAILPITLGGHGLRESSLVFVLTALEPPARLGNHAYFALLFFALTLLCSAFGGVFLLLQQMRRSAAVGTSDV
jgi:hypothetical protein